VEYDVDSVALREPCLAICAGSTRHGVEEGANELKVQISCHQNVEVRQLCIFVAHLDLVRLRKCPSCIDTINHAATRHKGARRHRIASREVGLVLLEGLWLSIDSDQGAIAFCILPSYSGSNVFRARARKVFVDLYEDQLLCLFEADAYRDVTTIETGPVSMKGWLSLMCGRQ
jgi:hypothetical protein